jgi:hypothetical protein
MHENIRYVRKINRKNIRLPISICGGGTRLDNPLRYKVLDISNRITTLMNIDTLGSESDIVYTAQDDGGECLWLGREVK